MLLCAHILCVTFLRYQARAANMASVKNAAFESDLRAAIPGVFAV
jgi:hypothetical protein